MAFDIVLRGGQVVDGTGAPARTADVGIVADRIAAVGPALPDEGADVVDVSGLVVAPGFIDTHTHSDVMLLADPIHERGIRQGITTEILGQDGLSYAPLSQEKLLLYRDYLAGLNGRPDIGWDWSSVAEYRARFERATAINTAWQVPHGALRLEVLGMVDRPLKGKDLERAQQLMAEAFAAGAVAFSTGLSYYPCSWSDTEELVELCRVAAHYRRPYVTHIRTVFREPQKDYLQAAIEETLEIGRRSGVAIHFSHFRTSPASAGQVEQLLAPIVRAMDEGLDITLETYPYSYGSGYAVMYLPPWVHEGGPKEILQRLADPGTRQRIRDEIAASPFPPQPDETYTHVGSPAYRWAEGMTFAAVGQRLNMPWLDSLLLLLYESELEVGMKGAQPADERVDRQLQRDLLDLIQRPYYMVGSDSIPVGSKPHPRAYGSFPRFFRLAREHGFPSLETLVQRMTATPAQRFGLHDRGRIEEGLAADVVVFDPTAMADTATYENPRQFSRGVHHVIVNGQFVLRDGRVTGSLPGRALRPAHPGGEASGG